MRKLALWAGVVLVLGAGIARPQDADNNDDATAAKPRPTIKVLQNPYDIASFYRSNQGGSGYFSSSGASRYPIASFYRGEGSPAIYGYSRFWTSGYGYGETRSFRGEVGYGVYRRRIGQNGDIFLLAPTVLAPVGPLTGVFSDR